MQLTDQAGEALRKYAIQRFEIESDDYAAFLQSDVLDTTSGPAILAAAEVCGKSRDDSPSYTPATLAWLKDERRHTAEWITAVEDGEEDGWFRSRTLCSCCTS